MARFIKCGFTCLINTRMVNFDCFQNNYPKKSHERHIGKIPSTFKVSAESSFFDKRPTTITPLGENIRIGKNIIWPAVKLLLISKVSAGQYHWYCISLESELLIDFNSGQLPMYYRLKISLLKSFIPLTDSSWSPFKHFSVAKQSSGKIFNFEP